MKAHAFHLNTDVPEDLRDSSEDGRITRVPLDAENEMFIPRVRAGDYCEGYRMVRFGARFLARGQLTGLAYGIVFQVLPGWEPPNAEIFYDWCDSISADVAELARWILDSGCYDALFTTGDVLAIDAFEFLPEIDPAAQRMALREVATALRRRFRRLRHAVVVVHPHHCGEPPKIDGGSRRVKTFRRALAGVLEMARELHLTQRLQLKTPRADLLIGRDRSIDPNDELMELARRAGILRRVLEESPRGGTRSRLGPDIGL